MTVNATPLNLELLTLVAAAAIKAVSLTTHKYKNEWVNAINAAVEEFTANPFFQYEDGVLIFNSSTSNELYEVGPDGHHTGCTAYKYGKPCKHRAGRRLFNLYCDAENFTHTPVAAPEPQPQPATKPTFPHYRRPAINPDSPAKRALDAVKPVETEARPYPEGALIAPSLLKKPELYGGIEI